MKSFKYHSTSTILNERSEREFGIVMGRIKTQLIKRLTFQLINEHKDEFAKDFESNKKIADFLLNKPNKKIRNSVAGYLTKLMKHKEEL